MSNDVEKEKSMLEFCIEKLKQNDISYLEFECGFCKVSLGKIQGSDKMYAIGFNNGVQAKEKKQKGD